MDISKFFDVILAWMNIHNHKDGVEISDNGQSVSLEKQQPQQQPEIDCEMPDELQQQLDDCEESSWDFPADDVRDNSNHDLETVEAEYRKSKEKMNDVGNGTGKVITEGKDVAAAAVQERQPEVEAEPDVPSASASLLDNKPLVKLFGECADLLNEIDKLAKDFKSDREQFLLEMVKDKILSALVLSGGKAIDNDSAFDILRHTALDVSDAKNETEIRETVSPGVMLEDRVFIRAKVNLK